MKLSKSTKNWLVVLVLLGVVAAGWAYWYVYYKPHRNVADEKPAFELNAAKLSEEVKADATSISKYIDKAVLVSGNITELDGNKISIGNVVCSVDSAHLDKVASLKVGDAVKVQGRITTYNDLLEEITIDNAAIK